MTTVKIPKWIVPVFIAWISFAIGYITNDMINNFPLNSNYVDIKCQITSGILYYSPECPYCQRQIMDGTLDELESLGVEVETIDVTGVGDYSFIQYVPTWLAEDLLETGYKNITQLKQMFGCD